MTDASTPSSSSPLTIDVWSDIACPWCYIGKRNLETGLAAVAGEDGLPDVEVVYHSFELSPDTPVDFEGDSADYLARHKGIPREQAVQMGEHVTRVAAGSGLDYRMDRIQHTNTRKAHELLHFAKAHGRQIETSERLMSAYFTEGRHVGRVDELVDLAAEAGLEADAVRASLEAGEYADAVQVDVDQARAYGIQGVPFFVIDGRYGVSGAQPAEAFSQVVRQVAAERAEA